MITAVKVKSLFYFKNKVCSTEKYVEYETWKPSHIFRYVIGSLSSGVKVLLQYSGHLQLPKLKLVMFGVILTSLYASMAYTGTNEPVARYRNSGDAYKENIREKL